MLNKFYLKSRKIHRFLAVFAVVFGLLMSVTGAVLKYGLPSQRQARILHNAMSPLFTLLLLGMIITGLFIFLFPYLKKKS